MYTKCPFMGVERGWTELSGGALVVGLMTRQWASTQKCSCGRAVSCTKLWIKLTSKLIVSSELEQMNTVDKSAVLL